MTLAPPVIATPESNQPVEQIAHYVIVRTDLPVGSKFAMVGHAAGESGPGMEKFPKHCYFLALAARDEAHLKELSLMLTMKGIVHRPIYESDGPYCGQMMSLGIPPQKRDKVYRLLSQLPKLKGDE